MDEDKPNLILTGISGRLGIRLLPHLKEYAVTGIGLTPPGTSHTVNFVRLDLGLEESCRELFLLMRTLRPVAVIHLASFTGSSGSRSDDAARTWQINVAGTARVFEALTEVNRDEEIIKKFIFLSCALAYGTRLGGPVSEDQKLAAASLSLAIHKLEADQAVQQRAPSARGCSVYLLRSAVFAGAGISNYFVGAFRGAPPRDPDSRDVRVMKDGKRLPCILPWGKKYAQSQIQFVHVEDVARVIQFILRKTDPESKRLTILNVAGRGEPLALQTCAEISGTKLLRIPGRWATRQLMSILQKIGVSEFPPEAVDYLFDGPIINTGRLRDFLGPYYEDVIRYTISEAFADSFAVPSPVKAESPAEA
ncbi:MAG: NAD-dependent epimerase/dehydratase family protein [Terriglobales bacterium]